MEVAFVALTETCTFLLDSEGICRFSVLRPEADKTTREAAQRCLLAQYVASIDPTAEGLLVHEPKAGRSLLFARVGENGRIALVRSGPLLEFQRLDPPKDVDDACPPKSMHEVRELVSEDEEEAVAAAEEPPAELAAAPAQERALEQVPEQEQPDTGADEEGAAEFSLPLSEEIKLALDRLDDLPGVDAHEPLDDFPPLRLDDEPTVERPSSHPPPLSVSLLSEDQQRESEIEEIEEIEDATAEHPSVRPPSPSSPEHMLAKVMLADDEGEDLETLLVLDQLTLVEADGDLEADETEESKDRTTRFARVTVPRAPGSEPITIRAPVTVRGLPLPENVPVVRRRGLLPRLHRS